MNSQNKPCISPFTFKLEDCLTCSYCISDFEQRKEIKYEDLKDKQLTILISPHSKTSMYLYHIKDRCIGFEEFESLLISFLRYKFDIVKIYDTSFIKHILYDSVYTEYTKDNKYIISDCPGTVKLPWYGTMKLSSNGNK